MGWPRLYLLSELSLLDCLTSHAPFLLP
jgi:hypothetical protein